MNGTSLAAVIASAAMLVTTVAPLAAQDLSLFEKKEFVNGQDTLRYRILYPEGYEPGVKYPLILFLHGSGERGRDNAAQLTHGMKLFVEPSNRSRYKCIVIAPQCPPDMSWNSGQADRNATPVARTFDYKRAEPKPLAMAIALTEQVIKEGKADSKRVYICGLSMGGMGTFEAVGRYPRLFKAAVPICGGGDTAFYGKQQAKVDFWIFHGDADQAVDAKYSRDMYARLQALKASVKYTAYPGVGHDSWNNAFDEPDFLPWLLKKR